MSSKNQPMYVSDWLTTRAVELVEHMRRHHTITDVSTWEQHIGELLQEEADRNTLLLDAARAWKRAIETCDGVYAAEQALMAAIGAHDEH